MTVPPGATGDGDVAMTQVTGGDNLEDAYSAELTKNLAAQSLALRDAYAQAEDLTLLCDKDLMTSRASLAVAVTEVTELRARVKDLETGVGEGRAMAGRLADAEALAGDLRAELEKERASRSLFEAEVARGKEREAKDAATIANIEKKLMEVSHDRIGVEGRLEAVQEQMAGVVREGRERSAMEEAAQKRLEFLEKERVRMEVELAEARSLHEVAVEARRSEVETVLQREKSARSEVEAGRMELEAARRRVRSSEEQVADLRRQVVDLQSSRERARADGQREVDNLTGQIEILRENEIDAEARFREFKEVIAGMSAAMKAKDERAVQAGGLGGHADALLRHVQADLDNRLEELERAREEFEAGKASERKMAIAIEALGRERETAVAAAEDAETRARVAEESLQDALRRCDRLERRVMLAGSVGRPAVMASGAMPMISAADGGGPVMMMDIAEAQNDVAMRPQLPLTPSKFSLDAHLDEVAALRQRHDDLVATIAAQRDMYRKQSSMHGM